MKKLDELSLERTFNFARTCYADRHTLAGEPFLAHGKRVAAQAEVIAHKLYGSARPNYFADSVKDNIVAVVHCGLLHDVLNVSACTFENVAEVANVQIAAMVAAISRDFRLVETKRDMEFRGRLSQSPIGSQIVVVADGICTAQFLLNALDKSGKAAIPAAKKLLSQIDGDLLAVHAAQKYYTLRMYVHAAKNLLSDISQKIKACRQQAKLDKMLAQTKKTVEAAKESAPVKEKSRRKKTEPTAQQPEKKRKARYARKRNIRQDSE